MKYIKIFILVLVTMATFSCQEQLDLQPEQSLSTGEALADIAGMETALLGAYDALQNVNYYGREFVVIPEIEADLVYLSINNSNRFVLNYTYQFTPTNGDFTGMWNIAYSGILRANNVINNIDGLDGDKSQIDQLKGEALALRALFHFDLVRYFAKQYTNSSPTSDLGVPIVLEAAIEEPARNTIDEVYNQVIADLNEARGLLNVDNGLNRFSVNAVDALLARVQLYKGDYSAAEAAASNVINSGAYEITDDIVSAFAAPGSSEEIFTLFFDPSEDRGSDNMGGIYNPEIYGDIRVATDAIDLFEEGDARLGFFYDLNDETYQSKYFEQNGINGLHSPKILRISEMYLIRAEARAQQGNGTGAAEDLNAIRTNRGVSELTNASVADVLEERQRELMFEGHTTFDYWRNGIDMVRDQCNTGIELNSPCTIGANDNLTVHPIPQREIDVNQNMVQNPGYL